MKEESEEKLIKKAQNGETEAFGVLYDKHIEPIYRFVYLKVSHQADAEDITQQVFLNAWQNIRRYQSRGFPFSSWLYKIAHNSVIDYYRTNKSRLNLDLETVGEISVDINFSSQIDQRLGLDVIKKAVKKLPPDQQTIVIMKFVEEMSNKEIAKILGKTEGALRVLQHRALKQLKKHLDESRYYSTTEEA